DWWIRWWEPSYREVQLSDLRSVKDLADIAFDSGVQLGAGKVNSVRQQALSSVMRLEGRLRKETGTLVEELLAGWRSLEDDEPDRIVRATRSTAPNVLGAECEAVV